jgi:hypothetical protein
MQTVRQNSGNAAASMVLGILGVTLCPVFIPSVIAVVLGHAGLRETRDGTKSGHGRAVAGLILGYIVVGGAAMVLLIILASMIIGTLAGS